MNTSPTENERGKCFVCRDSITYSRMLVLEHGKATGETFAWTHDHHRDNGVWSLEPRPHNADPKRMVPIS